ncbi:hypothetical protein ACOM2C_16340 [Pseudarthrobacter sp. So.54]
MLEPASDAAGKPGTLVTEEWDAREVRARILLRLVATSAATLPALSRPWPNLTLT